MTIDVYQTIYGDDWFRLTNESPFFLKFGAI